MKTLTGSLAILFFVGATLAGSLKDLDSKNGFRDLRFESPGPGVEFIPVGGEEPAAHTKYMTRPSDDLHIGGASLKSIMYVFYKGRFSGVMLNADSYLDCSALRDSLSAAYGDGVKTNRYIERYFWWGRKVSGSFQLNEVSNTCMALFQSKALVAEQDRDEKAAAEKGKSDL